MCLSGLRTAGIITTYMLPPMVQRGPTVTASDGFCEVVPGSARQILVISHFAIVLEKITEAVVLASAWHDRYPIIRAALI